MTRGLIARLGLLVGALLAASLPATAANAATTPPGVTGLSITGAGATQANVYFTLPASDGGSPLLGVKLLQFQGQSTTASTTYTYPSAGGHPGPGENVGLVASPLVAGTLYRFKVRAYNAVGDGALSAFTPFVLPPFKSVDQFVNQQYHDFLGRTPTTTEFTDLKTRVSNGTTTAAAALAEVSARPEYALLDPVTRIYYAFFNRAPDTGGLKYWLAKRRAGGKLSTISNQFAGSAEFKTTYGSLSNTAFVQLVYQNVLGRAGDAAGVSYWAGTLTAGTKTRGDVMLAFSESAEGKTRRAGEVNTVAIFFGMVVRAPYGAELTTWVPLSKTSRLAVAGHVLGMSEYDTFHVP